MTEKQLKNVHLPLIQQTETELCVAGDYEYYHYNCDGFKDAVSSSCYYFSVYLFSPHKLCVFLIVKNE
jgi:hypothetical protein